MSTIDFQNGLICGMAARGLVKSGITYLPIIWNDEGEYSYFYIDFKRPLEAFSTGMFNESVIVHDSVQLAVTKVEKISAKLYKAHCDISNKLQGVTVINKKTSLLSFITGETVPPFSTHFFVSGIESYSRLKYLYEQISSSDCIDSFSVDDAFIYYFDSYIEYSPIYEEAIPFIESVSVDEAVSISLT